MFRTVFPSIIRSSKLYIQQQAYVKQILLLLASRNEIPTASSSSICLTCLLLYVQFLTPDDGRKDRPKHVQFFQNKINLRHWCIGLV